MNFGRLRKFNRFDTFFLNSTDSKIDKRGFTICFLWIATLSGKGENYG